MWGSPREAGRQQGSKALGKQDTSCFPEQQNPGSHGVGGKGKSGGLHNKACSLFCFFQLKVLSIWSQVKNNSPLSPPSFKGHREFLVLQWKTRGSYAKRCLQRCEQLQLNREHPDANDWGHSDSASSGQWQIFSLTKSILILFLSLLMLCFTVFYVDHFPDFSHLIVDLDLNPKWKHTNVTEKRGLLPAAENSWKKTPILWLMCQGEH